MKLSTGFTGGSTKSFKSVDREVESRIKKMDVFTDDFSPPGTSEAFPGGNFNKRDAPYGKAHDDFVGESVRDKVGQLAAAGNAYEQKSFDALDEQQYQIDAPIKPYKDQFPGSKLAASDNAAFDVHQTDPARLSLSRFDKLIEARLARASKMTSGSYKSDNADLYDQRRK